MAASAEDVEELPAASCLCSTQGSVQAAARPGSWIPGIRSLHMHHEKWLAAANPTVCCRDVQQAVSQLRTRSNKGIVFSLAYVKETVEMSEIEIHAYSKERYVFVVKMKFVALEGGGCEAAVKSFATGIMPAWFPLCFVFSCLFFLTPFPDFGYCAYLITVLKERITIPIEVKESGRQW